jgi:Domain of unknown function (DUF4476)
MKKIFTLLTSLILGMAVFAADARPKSTLTIKSVDKADLKVVVDGRRFEPNHNSIKIQGLDAGYHQVKIYKEKNMGLFTIFGKRYEVVFNSSITTKPRTDVTISIDRFNRTTVSNDWGNDNKGRYDHDNKGWSTPGQKNWDDEDDFDFNRGNNYGDYNDRDSRYSSDASMNDREFRQVLESIQKEWLESNKLKSATHIVTSNRLTSAQVKQMLILFSFENNKLELAKSAYANTVDKRNYTMVYDAFSFNSSKDELAHFIRNFR